MTLNKKFELVVLGLGLAALSGCGIDVDNRKVSAGDLVGPRANSHLDSGNLAALSGCGLDNDASEASEGSFVVPRVRQLEGQLNQIYFNNVVFLWPTPLSSDITKSVIVASDLITSCEDNGIQQRNRIQGVDQELETAKASLSSSIAAAALEDGVREKIESLVAKLEELSNLTPMAEDQEYAAQLQGEIDALNAELAGLATPLPTSVAEARAQVTALFGRRTKLNHKLYYSGKFVEEQLAIIESRTNNFIKPDRVNIDLTGAGTDPSRVKITMVDWPEKGVTLSTDSGSIRVLELDPSRFGHLVYLVNTSPGREYYRFRLNTTRTEMEERDGRIFLQGEVFKYSGDVSGHFEGRPPERRGVAKFVNRN